MEASFRISKWFEIFAGVTYTFAGQHIPREGDCQAGFVATFGAGVSSPEPTDIRDTKCLR